MAKTRSARNTKSKKSNSAPPASMESVEGSGVGAAASASPSEPPPSSRRPTDDEIARRAYELFLLRGPRPGGDLEDWLEAEQQLCAA